MNATTAGGPPAPDLTALARTVLEVLELERAAGAIPEHAILRVLAIDDAELAVLLSGLDDAFLLGPAAPTPAPDAALTPRQMTLRAARLWRTVEQAVMPLLPMCEGMPCFDWTLWMQTEAQTLVAAPLPHGVLVVRDGVITA